MSLRKSPIHIANIHIQHLLICSYVKLISGYKRLDIKSMCSSLGDMNETMRMVKTLNDQLTL